PALRRPQSRRTRRRSLGVSPTAFIAPPPDLQFWPLMDMDFANACPLVRPALPHIRFLFVGSRLCSTLPSDSPSQFCPCALLVLHLHQVAQGTFTPKLSDMSDTQTAARRLRRWPVASLDCGCARRHPEPRSGRRNGPRGRTKKLRPLPDLFAEFSRRDYGRLRPFLIFGPETPLRLSRVSVLTRQSERLRSDDAEIPSYLRNQPVK